MRGVRLCRQSERCRFLPLRQPEDLRGAALFLTQRLDACPYGLLRDTFREPNDHESRLAFVLSTRCRLDFLRRVKDMAATMFRRLQLLLSLMQSAAVLLLLRLVRSKHYTCPQSAKWDSTIRQFPSILDLDRALFSLHRDRFRACHRIQTHGHNALSARYQARAILQCRRRIVE